MKYYSTKRPLTPGSYPKKDGQEIVIIFPAPEYCEPIGRKAWGYIDYPEALPPEDAESYELVPEGRRFWYAVTSTFDDHGCVAAAITNVAEFDEPPQNRNRHTARKDIYLDWFRTKDEADGFIRQAKEENRH